MTLIDARRLAAVLAFALVAALFVDSANATPRDFGSAFPAVHAAPAAALPIPTGAKRPIRNTASRACNDCWFAIYLVPQGQLLQIDNVSCLTTVASGSPTKLFALSPGFNFSQPLTAIIPPTQLIATGPSTTMLLANVSGPYFFGPGEGVYMFSAGNGLTATCTISGYLSAAQ